MKPDPDALTEDQILVIERRANSDGATRSDARLLLGEIRRLQRARPDMSDDRPLLAELRSLRSKVAACKRYHAKLDATP